jgi:hypothetical protein
MLSQALRLTDFAIESYGPAWQALAEFKLGGVS